MTSRNIILALAGAGILFFAYKLAKEMKKGTPGQVGDAPGSEDVEDGDVEALLNQYEKLLANNWDTPVPVAKTKEECDGIQRKYQYLFDDKLTNSKVKFETFFRRIYGNVGAGPEAPPVCVTDFPYQRENWFYLDILEKCNNNFNSEGCQRGLDDYRAQSIDELKQYAPQPEVTDDINSVLMNQFRTYKTNKLYDISMKLSALGKDCSNTPILCYRD